MAQPEMPRMMPADAERCWEESLLRLIESNRAARAMAQLYSPTPTFWQKARWRARVRWHRVRDAWLVLTGKADIDAGGW